MSRGMSRGKHGEGSLGVEGGGDEQGDDKN